jgi:excisionase family DNA binding protein
MMNSTTRFAFLDEGEALRRLGIDRDTLLTLVREKRLRAYDSGGGKYFRASDVEKLLADLRAEAGAAPEDDVSGEGGPSTTGRKVFDPAYKVHVRLQADLKWYDLEDEDLRAWVREMTPDGYARQRTNVTRVIEKLQRLIELMDGAAAGWQTLAPPRPAMPGRPTTLPGGLIQPTVAKRQRKALPMAGPDATRQPQPPKP